MAAACPDCGGAVELSRVATQYQEDLPVVRPIVRRFDIEVGHCSQCRRRVQGRHRLQTSDALGAASVQLGPEVVALVVRMHTHLGVPLAKVAHRDGTTPHVHVVANRVSTEDGRAAPLSQSRLQLSRWAESYERKQGRIQCPRRVEHNRDRRLVGPQYDPTLTASMYDWHATGDAHYRRTQCGRIARVPIADGRTALAMAGVAVRRVDEQRKWQTVRARRDEARAPLDETQRREWAALYARQEDERDRLDWDARSLRGRVERWRTSRGFWSDLGGVIRGKAFVLDRWRHDLERDQREDRAALGHEHSAQALEVDRRAQRTNERAMKEPVMLRQQDLAAIAQELKSQGLQPGVEAGRALARIANGALAHMGITSERTHERDYDRDFGPSR